MQHKAKRVTKSDFLGLVAEVWSKCFNETLIKKAYEKCGIIPLNRNRYPKTEFAPHLLELYNSEKNR